MQFIVQFTKSTFNLCLKCSSKITDFFLWPLCRKTVWPQLLFPAGLQYIIYAPGVKDRSNHWGQFAVFLLLLCQTKVSFRQRKGKRVIKKGRKWCNINTASLIWEKTVIEQQSHTFHWNTDAVVYNNAHSLMVTLSFSPSMMLLGVRSRWTILFSLCRYRSAKHIWGKRDTF